MNKLTSGRDEQSINPKKTKISEKVRWPRSLLPPGELH